jgi:hypothetical protein
MRLLRYLVARYFRGVFTRPDDLTEGQIRAELAASWNFAAQTLSYLPVGFGSHHWQATNAAGRQLFLIVHDLPHMLHSRLDTAEAAFTAARDSVWMCVVIAPGRESGVRDCAGTHCSGAVVRRLSGAVFAWPLSGAELTVVSLGRYDFRAADRPAVVPKRSDLHWPHRSAALQRLFSAKRRRAAERRLRAPRGPGVPGIVTVGAGRACWTGTQPVVTALMTACGELAMTLGPGGTICCHPR